MTQSPQRQHEDRPATVVAEPTWLRAGSWIGCPVLGAGLGWLLANVVGWALTLPWFPMEGPLRLASVFLQRWGTPGALVIGVVAGLVVAGLWAAERLTITVSPHEVVFRRGGKEQRIDPDEITAVFRDQRKLVLLGAGGRELTRESSDLGATALRGAFEAAGYPWRETDPYAEDYRLWVPDIPDLDDGAGAVLSARQRALQKDDGDGAKVMRAELAKLGVVVRDEGKQQYWRRIG